MPSSPRRRTMRRSATTTTAAAGPLLLLALLAGGAAAGAPASSVWGVPSTQQQQQQQQHQLPGFLARRGGFFSSGLSVATAVRAGRVASAAAASSRWLVRRRGGAVPPLPTTAAAASPAPSAPQQQQQQQQQLKLASPSQQEAALYEMLMGLGQDHLFQDWPAAGQEEEEKRAFFSQLAQLNGSYPGGIAAYVTKARRLLASAVAQENPFDGMTPSVPDGETLAYGTPEFAAAERAGLAEAGKAAFVLVAGGLGERLGYGGIKLALPVESTTGATYLEFYASYILALQARARALAGDQALEIPLVIMTSDDTDAQTRALLAAKGNFGMGAGQVTIVKQDKVPALQDAEARLAPSGRYELDTKPHGHGDVHHLLLRSGLTEKWLGEGRRWVFFLQDTNALVVNSVLPALAVSATKGYDMNSICIPRQAGEASGAITKLTKHDGSSLIINVEYNQLDPLLRATTYPEGDTNDPATGCSPFPGNANNIVFALPSYHQTLKGEDQGVVEEFVNPKFKDASRTAFTKPTRLECMMQDFPKLLAKELPGQARIGFTSFEKWLSFSPAKNALDAGAKGITSGVPPATASSAEMEFYKSHALKLRKALGDRARLQQGETQVLAGIPLETGPRLVLSPALAVTTQELQEKLGAGKGKGLLQVSGRSTLVLDGPGITVESLDLDGTLVVQAGPKARVTVRDAVVRNDGWQLVPVGEEAAEEARIRGFVVGKEASRGAVVVDLRDAEGDFVVTGNGEVLKQ